MDITPREILVEALSIFDERERQYGNFAETFRASDQVLGQMSPDFQFRLPLGSQSLSAMIAVKISRLRHNPSDDTLLDLINYLAMFIALRRNFDARNNPTEAGA